MNSGFQFTKSDQGVAVRAIAKKDAAVFATSENGIGVSGRGGRLASSFGDENENIGIFSRFHNPTDRGTFTEPPSSGRYRLRYTIDQR